MGQEEQLSGSSDDMYDAFVMEDEDEKLRVKKDSKKAKAQNRRQESTPKGTPTNKHEK